ncbi:Uncharacterised protein [Salmonella enterica subsp. enterica serovar Typhi]|nr:hypothetical protein [Salmonella enterica]CWY27946.1 Uncharacterised protein [Salmonella enterica subsp. enterica serovar Typhi]CWY46131.1 Uncharacterised protein [Salmonella enterica subsp. enterica serovar Typhi]CWY86358.1 Uncharacterised protein [Salmonella enterica subsp. enterica serovar Typhi]CWY91780.1 Uncharacterised protein [Salmonella enterica subsp. enterica serovar Typhi]
MNVYQLKNRTDVLIWLSLIEGDLLSIQASLNAGLYPLYDDRQEESEFECAVFNCGMAFGEFMERLESEDIDVLTTAGHELTGSIEHMGRMLCEPVWTQAVLLGRNEARADRAICAAEADGWLYDPA